MRMTIASPCRASWDSMIGDERARFCGRCKLNVYNLSGMTEAQANALIEQREGKICVRYYQRPDGTVLTQDCPVRFRTLRRRLALAIGALLAAGAAVLAVRSADSTNLRSREPFATFLRWLGPDLPVRMGEPVMMGKPCPPPPGNGSD